MVDVKIKTLLTIVETGNYTRAAQLLNLTQPAVSHHIRMLEAEYGIKIFNRNKKELLLTPCLFHHRGRETSYRRLPPANQAYHRWHYADRR